MLNCYGYRVLKDYVLDSFCYLITYYDSTKPIIRGKSSGTASEDFNCYVKMEMLVPFEESLITVQ
jgi:hypothetical protein